MNRPRISVLIPSFRRPDRLAACLESLDRQSVRPDEVFVVWQADDVETHDAARKLTGAVSYRLIVLHSPEAGVVPAENLALDSATGDVIALIDDDAVAPPDWLSRHGAFYADTTVGAVGGPADNHFADGRKFDPVAREPVGRLTWYGRPMGNMHTQPVAWRDRPPAAVDSLVGYNLTLRRAAFDRFETGLRRYWQGFELDACLQVAARGYRVLFDFGNVVDHFPSNPTYAPGREGDLEVKIYNGAYNHAFVLSKHSRALLRPARIAFQLLVGGTATPGLLGALAACRRYGNPRREAAILARTWRAAIQGWRAGARCRAAQRRIKLG